MRKYLVRAEYLVEVEADNERKAIQEATFLLYPTDDAGLANLEMRVLSYRDVPEAVPAPVKKETDATEKPSDTPNIPY